MGKKPKSGPTAAAKHAAALEKHSEALKSHVDAMTALAASNKSLTAALKKQSETLAATLPSTPRQFVYSVLADYGLTSPVRDTTKLAALGFDNLALAGLAQEINGRHWRGVSVDTGAIQACVTIGDVIKVVAAAL